MFVLMNGLNFSNETLAVDVRILHRMERVIFLVLSIIIGILVSYLLS
jgi:hypothetical protein